eukprot:TRINITY_DN12747_c0_g2_i4.p1 TRINITY_DN12747_c0_g2~~TRINITY_DN12747_c0_g2_i4.p1  ORF type:complete len:364 (-),score=50.40 TRINITY_DN12747_c0_g2_i4:17-1108(-)
METGIDISSLLPKTDLDCVILLSFSQIYPELVNNRDLVLNINSTSRLPKTPEINRLSEIIDAMGELSAKSQGLKTPVTSFTRLITSSDRLYFKFEGTKALGILKVGEKNLFHTDLDGRITQLRAVCVLDFYVHESCQRSGLGKLLFSKMLAHEDIEPHRIAYDRPSTKLLSFLRKHYKLVNFIPQNNNFVIFGQYFDPAYKTDFRKETVYEERPTKTEKLPERIPDRVVERPIERRREFEESKGVKPVATMMHTREQRSFQPSPTQTQSSRLSASMDPRDARKERKINDIEEKINRTERELEEMRRRIEEIELEKERLASATKGQSFSTFNNTSNRTSAAMYGSHYRRPVSYTHLTLPTIYSV